MEHIPKVLVVDDDYTSRVVLQNILQEEGFVVILAVNGREGRRLAENEQPDLIIMDINMPEEDGITACVILKSKPSTANIPVIFISAVEDVASKVNGFNAGGGDYITKPFQVLEVIARVRLQIRLYHSYRKMVAVSLEQLKNLSDSQKNILVKPEDYPEANFSVVYLPAQAAGGDFYDVIHAGAGIYDYIVADISGHHTGTALQAAALKALLRQNTAMLYSPLENLNLVNLHLRSVLQEEQYATLIYARLNKANKSLTLINAGHPPAIIIRENGGIETITQSGDGLGLFDAISCDSQEIAVTQGDRIFLYSDGVIEQGPGGPIPRRSGLHNLINVLGDKTISGNKATVKIIQERLFPASSSISDDIVLLEFKVT